MNDSICVPYLNGLVKSWCAEINLIGNYGSHTLRKTFGYMHRTINKTDLPTLMVMLIIQARNRHSATSVFKRQRSRMHICLSYRVKLFAIVILPFFMVSGLSSVVVPDLSVKLHK